MLPPSSLVFTLILYGNTDGFQVLFYAWCFTHLYARSLFDYSVLSKAHCIFSPVLVVVEAIRLIITIVVPI